VRNSQIKFTITFARWQHTNATATGVEFLQLFSLLVSSRFAEIRV